MTIPLMNLYVVQQTMMSLPYNKLIVEVKIEPRKVPVVDLFQKLMFKRMSS